MKPREIVAALVAVPAVTAALVATSCAARATADLFATGGVRPLRTRPAAAPPSSPHSPQILLLALDGASRDLVYEMLRDGELPRMAELLGGGGRAGFPHAYLSDSLLSIFPSITMAAWTSALTGHGPGDHGVAGNEYFIREHKVLACPAPISFTDLAPTLEIYNDGYLDSLIDAPTVYERMHQQDGAALIWVSLGQVARGADALLLTRRSVLVDAAAAFVDQKAKGSPQRDVYAAVDNATIDLAIAHLDESAPPDVLSMYLPGIDTYAHVANEGPDRARRAYLAEVVDPALGRLTAALRAHHALDQRWVVVTADHGHTEVLHDHQHAIVTAAPRAVLRAAGFRVRPFQRQVAPDDPFSAVIAYGGPTAYVYLADRSRCPRAHDVCPWSAPPRYQEDVLAAADAFYRNDHDGAVAPGLRGALDLILVRRPRPYAEVDRPFEVYVGGGKTMAVDDYLAAHPHPTYVELAARLRLLAVGVHGERAGDVLLLTHDGDRDAARDRFYFAGLYRSFHGSPSRADSEIPLIVAHPHVAAATIHAFVERVIGPHPTQVRLTDLLLALRTRPPS
jgi:Type I phosphodiesterase / nucleotide pyrophosphatase